MSPKFCSMNYSSKVDEYNRQVHGIEKTIIRSWWRGWFRLSKRKFCCGKGGLKVEVGRPPKLTHSQTILWEIDAVRFSAAGFSDPDDWRRWCSLECFLLHFRNLIEFFGRPADNGDTLSVLKPERIVDNPQSQDELRKLYRNDLWAKYEVRKETEPKDKISRYLQHCTEQRIEDKTWRVEEMFKELEPLMSRFEALQSDNHRPWPPPSALRVTAFPEPSLGTATRR
jgi:hypothetical protein